MANEEHLKLLRQGVDIWNEKRPDKVDLSEANLSEANLSKADLRYAKLSRANLRYAKLRYANLRYANLRYANLSEANLSGTDLSGAKLSEADLSEADLTRANLSNADLTRANLSNTDLTRTYLSETYLGEVNLSRADLREVNLSGAYLIRANLSEANLSEVDLRNAYLRDADLIGTNLSKADLRNAYLRDADLKYADLSGANLSETDLSEADLSEADLSKANLSKANLSKANLSKANLDETELNEANLSGVNLSGVNLSGQNLIKTNFPATQLLVTNFNNANLTGACIEDWNINKETNFNNVICDYIYLKCEESEENGKIIFTERRPSNPDENFAPGDFVLLIQKVIETVDLIFRDGVEWKSFALSFQELNQELNKKDQTEETENDNQIDPLSIRAIETRDDGSVIIRFNLSAELHKGEIEKSFKEKYAEHLQEQEKYYQRELQAKDSQIQLHREYYTDFKEMFATLIQAQANKLIHINNMPNNGDTYNLNGPTGIAHSSGEIKDSKIAGVLNEAPQENINMIKVEIEQILQPLLGKYPTKTTSEQMFVASQAIQQIENNPSLKTRFINAAKEGSLAALEQSLNHPVCSFIINAVKGWQEA